MLEGFAGGIHLSDDMKTKRITKWAQQIRKINANLHRIECTSDTISPEKYRQIPSLVHVVNQLITKIEGMTADKRMLGLTSLFRNYDAQGLANNILSRDSLIYRDYLEAFDIPHDPELHGKRVSVVIANSILKWRSTALRVNEYVSNFYME